MAVTNEHLLERIEEVRKILVGNGDVGVCEKVRNLEEKEEARVIAETQKADRTKWLHRSAWGVVFFVAARMLYDFLAGLGG